MTSVYPAVTAARFYLQSLTSMLWRRQNFKVVVNQARRLFCERGVIIQSMEVFEDGLVRAYSQFEPKCRYSQAPCAPLWDLE
jgi:hypothetical protein